MMDFEDTSNVQSDDAVMEYEGGFRLVCDSKSLLYLFGEPVTEHLALVPAVFLTRTCAESASRCNTPAR